MTKGKLYVKYGPMGGEKTTWLIHQYTPNSLVFLPDTDHRSGSSLKAHNGQFLEVPARVIKHDQVGELTKIVAEAVKKGKLERILIDELNFFDNRLVVEIEKVRLMGVTVYAAGLCLDTDGQYFGATRAVANMADEAVEVTARCDYLNCQTPAKFNYFKGHKSGQVVVGAWDLYGCACPKHWQLFRDQYHKKV